jgi:hypothetical protein
MPNDDSCDKSIYFSRRAMSSRTGHLRKPGDFRNFGIIRESKKWEEAEEYFALLRFGCPIPDGADPCRIPILLPKLE